MKRFFRMVGMMMAETAGFIGAIYTMLWLTSIMYYNDIIMERSTLDGATNILGTGLTIVYLAIVMVTILKTVFNCVYEKGLSEI